MQPDLLSPEKEENTPESNIDPSASIPTVETTPAEPPAPANEAVAAQVSPSAKKKGSTSILAYIGLGVLVLLLIGALAWVGYWAYGLSTELTNTQQDLAALQADYSKLQTDYATLKTENEQLKTEMAQVQADLDKANTDLATAQADLSKSQDTNKSLTTRFDKGTKLAEVLSTFISVSGPADFLKIDKLIKNAKNQELSSEWDKVTSSPTPEGFSQFLKYLILATYQSMK